MLIPGWRHSASAWTLAACAAIGAVACGGDSSSTPTPPVTVVNTPPVIQSVTAAAVRVEADEEVQLTAVVQDTETPVGQLTYAWSSSPAGGTWTATGATARWRAPKGATTPNTYTLTLTVTEQFTSGGVQRTNQVSNATQVRYNDSSPEITALVTQFLGDFGTFSVTPEQCVRNFSDNPSCGKASELNDVKKNRNDVHIKDSIFSVSDIRYDSPKTFAQITAPCTFHDTRNVDGKSQTSSGTCHMTATYESFHWLLCDSTFEGSSVTTSAEAWATRFSHP